MNRIIITGNLVADPEAYSTQNGVVRSTFRVAVQRRFKNQDGKYDADFVTVIAWRQTAEFCNKYLIKGAKVAVEGSIQVRQYDAQDGSKRTVTEIIADHVEALGGRQDSKPEAAPKQEFEEVDDDGLPF